jgi:ATP-dependent DNA helicase RecG
MLPKDKSVTKSSRSDTSNSRPESPQDTPIQFVKGVGPRLGAIFASRGIHTVRDLLFFFPRAYEDRSKLLRISELNEGMVATLAVRVIGSRKIPVRGRFNKSMLEVRCTDESGASLGLKWFHVPKGLEQRFKPGIQIIVTGTVKKFMGRAEIVHPEITWGVSSHTGPESQDPAEENANYGRVVPIYTEIEGVSSRILRKVLWEALQKYLPSLSEDLPLKYLQAHQLPRLSEAVSQIHFPPCNLQNPQVNNL